MGLAAATLLSLAATWLLVGKYDRLRGELEDVQLRAKQGPWCNRR